MDLTKKRKLDEIGDFPANSDAGATQLSLEDACKIFEPFTHSQLLEIALKAVVSHPDVLSAVRSIADRDPSQRKLFIRGLGWDTTTEKLRSLFCGYGDLEEAAVILDKATGKSKGYGFVTFKHVDGALLALKEPSKKIDGRMTVTQLASAGVQGGPILNPNSASDVSARKICVANVPYDMPADRLLAHFSAYGEIEEGPLGFDKATGKSKGFALFVYKTAEAANASLVDPIKTIDGRQLSCKLAIEGKKGKLGMPAAPAPANGVGPVVSYGGFSGGIQAGPPMGHNPSIGGGGYGSGLGGSYGGSHYGGPGSTGYGGLGLGGSGGGLGGAGRGSSLYRLPQNPEGGQYSLSSSGYPSQHHQTAGTSPAPRVPPGGVFQADWTAKQFLGIVIDGLGFQWVQVYDSLLGTVAFSGSGDFVNADNLTSGLMNLIGCTLALLHFICSLRCGSFMIAGSSSV
ncbi:UBP1-associated protein 2C [Camellia lanceoleosa]|uniref:UBP1-associated protein 2C n=1 Tax=Camellia lanceoleosa TaxID=1840588 RepID=A0ACC0HBP2_9ERIC|nr:UBP1-associated protein 2C [Camellia lanceoleosa]